MLFLCSAHNFNIFPKKLKHFVQILTGTAGKQGRRHLGWTSEAWAPVILSVLNSAN